MSIDVPESSVCVLDPVNGEKTESRCPAGAFEFEHPYGKDAVIHIKALPPGAGR